MANLLFSQNAQAFKARSVSSEKIKIPRLPENDRQAMALAYKEDAASVDAASYRIAAGANCRNCQLYSGSEEDNWGPCAIFSYRIHPTLNQNFLVSAKGWCRSWAVKAG
ncbi:MAG: high-potential iron-sulfur protein [Gammaproteobacteria bacterium]